MLRKRVRTDMELEQTTGYGYRGAGPISAPRNEKRRWTRIDLAWVLLLTLISALMTFID